MTYLRARHSDKPLTSRHAHASPYVVANIGIYASVRAPAGAAMTAASVGPIAIGLAGAGLIALLLRYVAASPIDTARKSLHRRRVADVLRRHSDRLLADFLLESPYGGLTRVDFALCLDGGIVCVRTKRVSGKIVSDLEDPQWTVETRGRRRRFLNPIVQNEGRAEALRRLIQELPVRNIVVLDGDISFDRSSGHAVIPLAELDDYLSSLEFAAVPIENRDSAWQAIRSAAITDIDSRKDFAAQLSFG